MALSWPFFLRRARADLSNDIHDELVEAGNESRGRFQHHGASGYCQQSTQAHQNGEWQFAISLTCAQAHSTAIGRHRLYHDLRSRDRGERQTLAMISTTSWLRLAMNSGAVCITRAPPTTASRPHRHTSMMNGSRCMYEADFARWQHPRDLLQHLQLRLMMKNKR